MGLWEFLASSPQPIPTTLPHELRFSLRAQSALFFLLFTKRKAPIPPVLVPVPPPVSAVAGGCAVGASVAAGGPTAVPPAGNGRKTTFLRFFFCMIVSFPFLFER